MTAKGRQPARRGVSTETNLRRVGGRREQRATLLVATNGEKTEKHYLDALIRENWVKPSVKVRVEKGSPLDVVESLARTVRMDDYDEGWAVVDLDEYAPAEADHRARDLGLRLLWSVPCFEFWLLLHFVTRTVFVNGARECGQLLTQKLPHWDKTDLRYEDFQASVEAAATRAKAMAQPLDNPSTAVWQLVERLRQE